MYSVENSYVDNFEFLKKKDFNHTEYNIRGQI